MRGLRLKRAPGGQQCRRAALALLPSTFARGCFWAGDVLAGLGEGSHGPPCFAIGVRGGVGGRWLLQPLRPERR